MKRLIILALATTMSAAGYAQSWKNFYDAGIDAAKAGKWADARTDFLHASQAKHGDTSKGSGGGFYTYHRPAYTPDFLAAYAGLKESLEMTGQAKTGMLKQAAAEFETIINNKQYSAEAFFFLDETYVLLGENAKREELGQQYNTIGALNWKVDTKGIADDDEALVSQLPAPAKVYTTPTPAATKHSQPKKYETPVTAPAPALAIPEVPVASTDPDVKPVTTKAVPAKVSKPKKDKPQPVVVTTDPKLQVPAAPIASTDPDIQPVTAKTAATTPTPAATIQWITPAAKPTVVEVKTSSTQPNLAKTAPAAPAPATAAVTASAVSASVGAAQTPAPALAPAKGQVPTTPAPTETPAPTLTPDSTQTPAATTPATTPPVDQTPNKKQKKHRKDRDKSADTTTPAPAATTNEVVPVTPKEISKTKAAPSGNSVLGAVAPMGDKYAIIIGNSESKTPDGALPYAGDDAQAVRQSLITDGGYLDQNVEVVINATAAQIAATVNALSSRVPDKGTVFIYFTGVGTNIDGKDYLAGVDTDATSDSSTMISKDDIYRAFMLKGARIFAFYQANRPIVDGHYFGSEVPLVGSISQMEATLPGESIYSINANGKQVGLFTNGFISTMKDMRSNRTPILDFGWAVFYKLRRGDTGASGGSSNQSPSLPVPINMASDARF